MAVTGWLLSNLTERARELMTSACWGRRGACRPRRAELCAKGETMKKLARIGLVLVTILICVGCDQTTKYGAQSFLEGQSPVSFLGGFFNFTYAENTGAMLSFGGALPEHYRFIFFVLLVGVFLSVAAVYLIVKPQNKTTTIALSLIVGGGFGNLIDRVFNNGAVVDFMLIKIGSLQTGIFNVADIAITFGALALCFTVLRREIQST